MSTLTDDSVNSATEEALHGLADQHISLSVKTIRERLNSDAAIATTHCLYCGKEIPAARKKAYPAATTCVACATQHCR